MEEKLKPAIGTMETMMTPESADRAKRRAEQELLSIKLAQLREKCGLKQSDVANFTQTSVSKLERSKDMRLSTLIDYLIGLEMGLEIKAYPKNSKTKGKVLRRV